MAVDSQTEHGSDVLFELMNAELRDNDSAMKVFDYYGGNIVERFVNLCLAAALQDLVRPAHYATLCTMCGASACFLSLLGRGDHGLSYELLWAFGRKFEQIFFIKLN